MRIRTTRWMAVGSLAMLLVGVSARLAHAALDVTLTTDVASGQPVGTPVAMTVSVAGATGQLLYQFGVRKDGEPWRILRDYSVFPNFTWVTLDEGTYTLGVRVGTIPGFQVAATDLEFVVSPRTTTSPIVTATAHPLVALFSAPACSAGDLWIRFRPVGWPVWHRTSSKPCTSAGINIYVAGMRANVTYEMQSVRFAGGRFEQGPRLRFTTGAPTVEIQPYEILDPVDVTASTLDGVLLQANLAYATDLFGRLTWYYEPLAKQDVTGYITRPLPGGTMLAILETDEMPGQVLREIDLAGNLVRETTAGRVSQLLARRGEDRITSLHHDAIRLDNGHTLVIGSVERMLTDVQGPGQVNVYGETIIDLDENFQVAWSWNSFSKLDPTRLAVMGEVCMSAGPGCPPLFRDTSANDWLHANAIDYVPGDGSLLLSLRHQDWVIKIDYRNGQGDGDVLWRLGDGGDFAIVDADNDAWPWFSHQHDARMWEDGTLVLYDNGNTRVEGPAPVPGNSRGQVYRLDEGAMTATLVENFDLGAYSFALGSAQRLSNGNYHFNSGVLDRTNPTAQSIEISSAGGEPILVFQTVGTSYRSFRLQNLYRP